MAPRFARMALPLLALRAVAGYDKDGCTSIAVSSGATVDGSAMTSHANDCGDCDWRVVYVPARDHPEGSFRAILDQTRSGYPRMVDPSRSKSYHPAMGIEKSKVMGYIPQVPHTYALWEATYGLMNEKGLTIGESTCAAYLQGNVTKGNPTEVKEHDIKDGALLVIGNLIAIALERCETARCAIQTISDLGMKYGFYSEDGPGLSGAGEALTIADRSGETWVYHILGGLPEREGARFAGQRGALWAAQKVPRGHVAVIANNFIIREVDAEDTENFMLHPGLFELCREAGLWDGKGKFDFLRVTSPDLRTFDQDAPGTPPIPMYTSVRMWHVFSKVAPSLRINITRDIFAYPFSVPVDAKLSKEDVMNLFRSHYEGTPFDMRLGVLAGPFSSPNRAESGWGMVEVPGQITRGISIHRTAYTQVGQTGIPYPKLWFGPDASASSVFVPFYAAALAGGEGRYDLKSFGEGSMKELDFSAEVKPAWWAFDFVANWLDHSYLNMSETYVIPRVRTLQREVSKACAKAEAKAEEASSKKHGDLALAEEQTRIQRHVSEEWWKFAGMLVVRYNDLTYNFPEHAPDSQFGLGYPGWWLEMVGFNDNSFLPQWVQPSNTVPSMLPPQDRELAMSALETSPQVAPLLSQWVNPAPAAFAEEAAALQASAVPAAPTLAALVACSLATLAGGVALGYRLGAKSAAREMERSGYVQISA